MKRFLTEMGIFGISLGEIIGSVILLALYSEEGKFCSSLQASTFARVPSYVSAK